MKKIALNVLRVAVSALLLGYLLYIVDVEQILQTMARADLSYVVVAGLFFLGAVFTLSLRWHVLLMSTNDSPGYPRLVIFYFIGFFFNNFLPTSIGGDVSRIYNLARTSGNQALGIASVLLERVLGILATLTLASVALLWATEYFNTKLMIVLTISLLSCVLLLLASLLNNTVHQALTRVIAKIRIARIGERINTVLESIHNYGSHRATIAAGFALSLATHILLIIMNYMLALALGLTGISLSYLFLVVPVAFVISMTPSIGGWGVRDWGYLELLGRVGVGSAPALSLSFLNGLVPMLLSLIGGLLLLFYRNSDEDPVIDEV